MIGAMAPVLAPIFAPAIVRAASAEFTYKFATGQDPTHPVNIRLNEAFDRIRDKTSGKLDIKLFPANQLGTETNVISQIRNGGLEFTILSASILATLVPVSARRRRETSALRKTLLGSRSGFRRRRCSHRSFQPSAPRPRR